MNTHTQDHRPLAASIRHAALSIDDIIVLVVVIEAGAYGSRR